MARIDNIDLQILKHLQENAKLTTKELSAKVGISSTPTYERVKRLEKLGFIKNYVAIVDAEKLGDKLTILLSINLKNHAKKELSEVERQFNALPNIMECYHLTGEYDYFLKVMMDDMAKYRDFIINDLADIENIFQVKSHIVLNCVKSTTAVPLHELQ